MNGTSHCYHFILIRKEKCEEEKSIGDFCSVNEDIFRELVLISILIPYNSIDLDF